MTKSHRKLRILAGLATVSMAAGCGAVAGQPSPAEMDVRKLDVGSYSTDPNDLRFKYAPILDSGRYLAVMRLADAVPTGPDIDTKLDYGIGAGAITRATDAVNAKFAENFTPLLTKYDMLYGMTTASSDKKQGFGTAVDDTAVSINIFQFPDDRSADAAAKEFEAADFDIAKEQNQRVDLPKYPSAMSHWRPGIRTMGTRMARGSYVLNITVRTPKDDISALIALAQRTYDVQLPMLDTLTPLSKRDILRLPYDQPGILRRTLHPDVTFGPSVPTEMSLSRRAFLHFLAEGKNKTKAMVDKANIDAVGVVGKDILTWRTPDRDTARNFASELVGPNKKLVEPPAQVPDSSCWEADEKDTSMFAARKYVCVLRYDRYVGEVSSSQLLDTQQRATAQFALFANSSW